MFQFLHREWFAYYRNWPAMLMPLLFFLLVCLLFPLAISPEKTELMKMGPGVIWASVLLASLLSFSSLFERDWREGSLDQLLLRPEPLSQLVAIKVMVHWLFFAVPLILLVPISALLFDLSSHCVLILMISLLLGTPILYFQGAIVAALCIGLRQSALLLAILLLPLYIPTLVLGSAVTIAAGQGMPIAFSLALLGAILCLALTFGPMITAFALRIGIIYG